MNISTLLHHELMLVARTRAVSKFDCPKFTLKEEIAAIKHKRVKKLDHSPLDDARQFYVRIATLIEYQSLVVEVDNMVYLLFEQHKFEIKSRRLSRFWKYYIPLIKTLPKENYRVRRESPFWSFESFNLPFMAESKTGKIAVSQRMDAARYAFLRTLDEADQESTFGTVYRPDTTNVRQYEAKLAYYKSLTSRKQKRADEWHKEQQDRPLYESLVAENGSVRSSYALSVE